MAALDGFDQGAQVHLGMFNVHAEHSQRDRGNKYPAGGGLHQRQEDQAHDSPVIRNASHRSVVFGVPHELLWFRVLVLKSHCDSHRQ